MKWFCTDCKTFHRRWSIKKISRLIGIDYCEVRYMCPNCGNKNVVKVKQYVRNLMVNGKI